MLDSPPVDNLDRFFYLVRGRRVFELLSEEPARSVYPGFTEALHPANLLADAIAF